MKNWQPPTDMDSECINLCKSINEMEGIETVSSCSGHGEKPYRIFFQTNNLENLPPLLYWLDRCHNGLEGWSVCVTTDCGMSPVVFCLEGPIGAYNDAEHIAKLIADWIHRRDELAIMEDN